MANPHAGEVALVIDGQRRVLKLTLGALAELEESLGAPSLMALIERFESGRFSARDVMALTVKPTHTASSDSSSDCGIASNSENSASESSGKRWPQASRTLRMPTAAGPSATSGACCSSRSCGVALMLTGDTP